MSFADSEMVTLVISDVLTVLRAEHRAAKRGARVLKQPGGRATYVAAHRRARIRLINEQQPEDNGALRLTPPCSSNSAPFIENSWALHQRSHSGARS